MNWTEILNFSRGPLLHVAMIIFIAGLSYRLVRVLLLGWERDKAKNKGSKFWGAIVNYLKGLVVLPFIPWVRRTFRHNELTFIAGGLFHLSLFVILAFGHAHIMVWKSLCGFSWKGLPTPILAFFSATGIISMVILLLNRLTQPVLKLLTRFPVWINWLVVFLPMITGFIMARHLWFKYEVIFSLHLISVSLLLIWIPFGRISHFLFYFFSKTIHGAQAGKRAVTP